MTYTVVVTGNHYWIDGFVGLILMAIALVLFNNDSPWHKNKSLAHVDERDRALPGQERAGLAVQPDVVERIRAGGQLVGELQQVAGGQRGGPGDRRGEWRVALARLFSEVPHYVVTALALAQLLQHQVVPVGVTVADVLDLQHAAALQAARGEELVVAVDGDNL